jgi:hypothetical protein
MSPSTLKIHLKSVLFHKSCRMLCVSMPRCIHDTFQWFCLFTNLMSDVAFGKICQKISGIFGKNHLHHINALPLPFQRAITMPWQNAYTYEWLLVLLLVLPELPTSTILEYFLPKFLGIVLQTVEQFSIVSQWKYYKLWVFLWLLG